MPRPNRVRRTLAIRVTETRVAEHLNENSPGQRFAAGWQSYCVHGQFTEEGMASACRGDPIQVAGFLAAKAAWDAHHYAVNWIEIAPNTGSAPK